MERLFFQDQTASKYLFKNENFEARKRGSRISLLDHDASLPWYAQLMTYYHLPFFLLCFTVCLSYVF